MRKLTKVVVQVTNGDGEIIGSAVRSVMTERELSSLTKAVERITGKANSTRHAEAEQLRERLAELGQ